MAAVAGGCGLATACDLVVAEPGARFAYTEVRIGFLAAVVSTFLTRRVPGHVARRMLLDPEMLDGERAVEIGIATTNNFPTEAEGFLYLSMSQVEVGEFTASDANFKTYQELEAGAPTGGNF